MGLRIIHINFVKYTSVRHKRAEPVGKPLWHQKRPAVLGVQRHGNMLPEGWRSAPDIDGNVEDRPGQDAHQLGLCKIRRLEMQRADGAGRG